MVGGQTRDVEVTPQGQSAYVVNSTLSLLQVVNIDSLDPGYRKLSAQVGTGSAPVALDLSAGGSLIAVANRASGTISLYQQGATSAPVLTRLVPNVALPGDLVAAQGDETSGFVDPTQADLGFTTFPVGNPQNDGAGFRLWSVSSKTTLNAGILPAESAKLDKTFIDPVLAARRRSATSSPAPARSGVSWPARSLQGSCNNYNIFL